MKYKVEVLSKAIFSFWELFNVEANSKEEAIQHIKDCDFEAHSLSDNVGEFIDYANEPKYQVHEGI